MKNKKQIVFIIALIATISMVFQSFALDISADKSKLKEVNKKIEETLRNLKENESKQKSVSEEIKRLENQIIKLEREIEEIDQQISDTKTKIEISQDELKAAEESIVEKNDVLNSRLRVMYKNDSIEYLEVLLDSADFTDLLSRIDMVKKIFNHDVNLLKDLKNRRDQIEEKKAALESQRAQLLSLMEQIKKKQQNLAVSRGEMERVKKELVKDHKALEKQEDELNELAERIAEEIRRKQSTGKYVGGVMTWPAPGYERITSSFGYRVHPILKIKKLHTGIDIGVPMNQSIVAAQNGTVIHSGWLGGYGKVIMVDHGGGIVTLYAHNSKLLVKEGQRINKGQVIAKSGSTGMSTGPHLHFEVRENGNYVDPLKYVK